MSNSSLQPDQDALRESAIAVITYVRDAMHEGGALLKEHNRLLVENQGEHRLESEIQAINENLGCVNDNLERVKRGELTMTIVAPTSAGKSTIINAIAGQDLLPSRNDAMTVLPTEIVFSGEVTRPKLILNKALMTLLLEPWGQLHQKLQRIGLKEAVEQATKNDFPRENVIKEILNSSSVSEVEESNGIQAELIRINDLLRLCGIFGISTGFLSSLPEIPRIKVPFPPRLSSLKGLGLGTLVLVDTPGPSEDKSLDLMNVVKDRLRASSLVLVVVDYTKIGQTDPAKVKKLVDEIAAIKGRDRVYIIVNKIDDRDPNNPQDLTKGQILSLVKTKYKIDNPQNRVFEMSAVQAFLATNFQREKEIYRLTELRGRKSFEALGQEYYAKPWRTKKTTVTLEEMQEAADEFLRDSGFVGFIDKAIAPLVTDAAPSMITIKGALNDIGQKFADFLSCLREQKGILERDIQQLGIEINQLEIEITAIDSHITNISEVENIKSEAKKELNIILDTESCGLSGEIDHHANILLEKAIDLYPLESKKFWMFLLSHYSNYQMLNEISIFRDRYSTAIKRYYNRLTSNLLDRVKQIIEQINNDYSTQHELVLDNAQKRLHKIVRCDIKSDIYLDFIRHEGEIYRLMKSQDFVRDTSNGTNSMGTVFSHGEPSNTKHFITLSIEEYRWGCYSKSLLVLDDLRAWRGTIPSIFKYIGQNIICDIEKRLNEDIDAFIQQRDNLLREYKISLQFTIQTKKKIQNSYRIFVSQHSEFLDKKANLEKDLKYQQEYVKQH